MINTCGVRVRQAGNEQGRLCLPQETNKLRLPWTMAGVHPVSIRIGHQVDRHRRAVRGSGCAEAAHTVRRNGATCLLLVANREIEMIGRLIVCSTSTMHSTTAAVTAGDEGAPEEMEKTLRGQVPSPSGSVPARHSSGLARLPQSSWGCAVPRRPAPARCRVRSPSTSSYGE